MTNKTTKKLLLPLCLVALCLMTVKTPTVLPNTQKNPPQVMPLSDMEDPDGTIEEARK